MTIVYLSFLSLAVGVFAFLYTKLVTMLALCNSCFAATVQWISSMFGSLVGAAACIAMLLNFPMCG